jgi:integrase
VFGRWIKGVAGFFAGFFVSERIRQEVVGGTGRSSVFHDLCRSFGLEVARHVGVHMASRLLGHSDVRISARVYSPFGLDEQRDAAEPIHQARSKVLPFTKKVAVSGDGE